MTFGEIAIFILAVLVMLIGLVGIILPVLPGIPIILTAAFIFALIEGFQEISWNIIGIFTIFTVISLAIDWLSSAYGVKKMGGSYFGMAGAFIGMFIGLIVGSLIGLIIGAFLGAFIAEVLVGKKTKQALKAGTGSFIGFLLGGVLKFVIGAMMIGIFMWRVLF